MRNIWLAAAAAVAVSAWLDGRHKARITATTETWRLPCDKRRVIGFIDPASNCITTSAPARDLLTQAAKL